MNRNLVRKLINKECTPEELKQVQNWLVNTDRNEEVTALLKTTWENGNGDSPTNGQRKEEVYRQLMTKMDTSTLSVTRPDEHTSGTSTTFYRKHWWKVAAVVLLAIGVYFTNRVAPPEPRAPKAVATIEKTNAKGQKSTITLKDGSKVHLNSESTIRYMENYGQQTREIELVGEAFFEVAKDPKHPFIVKAGKITTTALGTSFNVRAFHNETQASVSLATGRVKVEGDVDYPESEKDFILKPGEEAIVLENQFIKQPFDALKVLSWKDGVILFDDASLDETLKVLERWYDVKFDVMGLTSPEEVRGTGQFKNQSLENVLRILGHSMKFEFEIIERKVLLKF